MIKINIKPLSVNKAWQGRRFKTNAYKSFEKELLLCLPSKIELPSERLSLFIEYGFSSKASDIDNPTKMVIDILSKKYGFNDNRIFFLSQEKYIVKKGDEYIRFSFLKHPIEW